MKREYKIWILVIIIEICCMSILGEMRVSIHSLLGKVVGIILIFGPITKILYMLSKDAAISLKKRNLSKIVLVFILFCLGSGIVGEVIKSILKMVEF